MHTWPHVGQIRMRVEALVATTHLQKYSNVEKECEADGQFAWWAFELDIVPDRSGAHTNVEFDLSCSCWGQLSPNTFETQSAS